jgi:hypothetical protein
MAYLTADHIQPLPRAAPGVLAIQRAMLWLVGISGGVVIIEPSPYEISTLLAVIVFAVTGLRMRAVFLVLIAMLAIINIGYSISAANLMADRAVVNWILTSWYMSITAIFFALALADDTAGRLSALSSGYLWGAIIASLAGIAGYFNLIPGAYELLTFGSRAKGTFKDPNVLGAFLIFPALLSLQGIIIGSLGKAIRSSIAFSIISFCIFLAFSRAAWGMLVGTSAFMLLMLFMTAPTQARRGRIILLTCAMVGLAVMMLAILLSMDSIAALFKERASLSQGYDSGRFGRFGRHVLGAMMVFDYPFGIGPLQFSKYFPEDTHNSFLNAFMSGGWLSGVFYPALIGTSVAIGFKAMTQRTPWQNLYIALFATFLGTVGESFIIDSDHWRHFFLMLGVVWGVAAATREWMAINSPGGYRANA